MFKWLRNKFNPPVEKEIIYLTRDESAEEARAQAVEKFQTEYNAGRRERGRPEVNFN